MEIKNELLYKLIKASVNVIHRADDLERNGIALYTGLCPIGEFINIAEKKKSEIEELDLLLEEITELLLQDSNKKL